MSVLFRQAQTPVVPSQSWQAILNFDLNQTSYSLQFPTSFLPAEEFLSAAVVCNSSINYGDFQIILPDSTTGSVGSTSIIYNPGQSLITVMANDGVTQIMVVNPGTQWTLDLYDNSTQNGIWIFAQLGALTSQAQATALAGQGLQAVDNKLNVDLAVINYSSPINIEETLQACMYNWTGATDTQNLPTDANPNFQFYFKNSSPSNGFLTMLAPTGSTIDGSPSIVFSFNESCLIIYDGTNWFTNGLGLNISATGAKITSAGIRVINGTNSLPSYSFFNAPNTGFFLDGSNIASTVNGNLISEITPLGINLPNTDFLWGGVPLLYFNNIYT